MGEREYKTYLMGVNDKYFKIGISHEPFRRRRDIQQCNPLPVKLIGFITNEQIDEIPYLESKNLDSTKRLEHYFHQRLASYNKTGEWFELQNEIKSKIKKVFTEKSFGLQHLTSREKRYAKLQKINIGGNKYKRCSGIVSYYSDLFTLNKEGIFFNKGKMEGKNAFKIGKTNPNYTWWLYYNTSGVPQLDLVIIRSIQECDKLDDVLERIDFWHNMFHKRYNKEFDYKESDD